MNYPIQELRQLANLQYIRRLVELEKFEFKEFGWYFFISKITGLLTIEWHHEREKSTREPICFRDLCLFHMIKLSDETDFTHRSLYEYFNDNLEELVTLQIHLTQLIIKDSKAVLEKAGVYALRLIKRTCNFNNFSKHHGSRYFYLFNAIDERLLELSLYNLRKKATRIDDFVNLFWIVDYGLNGFMIWNHYFPNPTQVLELNSYYDVDLNYIPSGKIRTLIPYGIYVEQTYIPLRTSEMIGLGS